MKMSAFPLPVGGFPNLATTQLLMSAAGGLNLPTSPTAGSPKDNPSVSMAMAGMAGGRMPIVSLADLSPMAGHPAAMAGSFLPPHMAAGMIDPRMIYSALNGSLEMKENNDAMMAWRQIAAQAQAASTAGVLPYDPHTAAMAAASFPYPAYPGMDLNGARRKNATRETTSTLKAWLYEHRKNPYPTKGEKIMLAIITKMTLTQVSTWFANARRRLKKENKMTWSPRNRTDDGSSLDGEEKVDDDDANADDDNISIDLSDFESETSPQKQSAVSQSTSISSVNPQPTSLRTSSHAISSGVTTTPVLPQQVNSSNKDTKPRIWSLADVAASKPSSHGGGGGPMHHSTSSVRHRPYPLPNNNNTTAFRPWFSPAAAAAMSATDSLAYRQLAAQSAALGNPLLTSALPTVGAPSSLRIPHVSTPSAHNPLLCTSSTVTPVSLNNHLSQSSTVLSDKTITVDSGSSSKLSASSSSKEC